jgi:hypothetical protein
MGVTEMSDDMGMALWLAKIGSLLVFRFDFTLWSTAEKIGVLHFS